MQSFFASDQAIIVNCWSAGTYPSFAIRPATSTQEPARRAFQRLVVAGPDHDPREIPGPASPTAERAPATVILMNADGKRCPAPTYAIPLFIGPAEAPKAAYGGIDYVLLLRDHRNATRGTSVEGPTTSTPRPRTSAPIAGAPDGTPGVKQRLPPDHLRCENRDHRRDCTTEAGNELDHFRRRSWPEQWARSVGVVSTAPRSDSMPPRPRPWSTIAPSATGRTRSPRAATGSRDIDDP